MPTETPIKPRPRGLLNPPTDPVLVEQARQLYLDDTPLPTITAITGIRTNTLSTWTTVKGWAKLRRAKREERDNPGGGDLETHSTRLKIQTAKILDRHLVTLDKTAPNTFKGLANDGQGHAAVLKTVVETAAKVFGWSESAGVNVQVNVMNDLRARPTPVASASQQAAPAADEP